MGLDENEGLDANENKKTNVYSFCVVKTLVSGDQPPQGSERAALFLYFFYFTIVHMYIHFKQSINQSICKPELNKSLHG